MTGAHLIEQFHIFRWMQKEQFRTETNIFYINAPLYLIIYILVSVQAHFPHWC